MIAATRSAAEVQAASGIGNGARAAGWLSLAATPAFAIMAVATGLSDAPDGLCITAHAGALNEMLVMYVLMSVFHAGSWLKLIGRQQASIRSM
jgi:hypothetical protein